MTGEHGARRVRELLGALAGHGKRPPARSTPLAALGIDSLAFAELVFALEEELGVAVEGSFDPTATVGDVLSAVEDARVARGLDVPRRMGRLQGAAGLAARVPLRWWLDLRVEGAAHVPERGPAILAGNHESALDIPVVVVACPRRIMFMAKQELYANTFTSWSLDRLGAFRVDRNRFDVGAIRLGLAVLGRGDVLGMYPEGTRSPGELLPFLPGAAWMALRTGAPLVPVSVVGTERAGEAKRPRAVRVRVTFGEPIPAARVNDPAERLRRAVALTATLRHAVGAGLRPQGSPPG